MQLEAGQILHHRYEIVRPLGEGGAGRAYLARDHARDRDVALKIVRAGSPELIEALKDEFSRLKGIVHPNLCEVRDFGFVGDEARHAFYTYSFIDASTLDRWAPARSWDEILRPLGEALAGLEALHRLGIVHGDFKPSNILVDRAASRGVLIDLSCSQLAGEACTSSYGTPGYVAPERFFGERVDGRCDLFAVGATLRRLEVLAGPPMPAELRHLADRLMREDPRGRPSDVAEVLEALGRDSVFDPPRLAQPPRLLGRERELATFETLLGHLLEGREEERALIVVGADGMGATRLLEEMKWLAQLRCPVVEGDASAPEPLRPLLGAMAADPTGAVPVAGSLPAGVGGLVRARERLRAEPRRPFVLLLDDAQLLEGADRQTWEALLRSVERDDPVLVVAATKPPLAEGLRSSTVRVCELAPLDQATVAGWIEPFGGPSVTGQTLALTGGCPAMLRELSRWLTSGRPIDRFVAGREGGALRRLEAVDSLGNEARRGLALLAARHGPADPAWLAEQGVGLADIGRLLSEGWAVVEGGSVRLARLAESPGVLEAVGDAQATDALIRVARWWSDRRAAAAGTSTESRCAARATFCLARAGSMHEARAALAEARALHDADPDPWAAVAGLLGRESRDPEIVLAAASILERAARPEESLGLLAALLRTRPDAQTIASLRMQAGACHLRAGRGKKALVKLQQALEDFPPRSGQRSRVADLLARALIQTGHYDRAAQVASEALERADEDALCADLHDDLGVALGYLGRVDDARRHLREANALHATTDRPRALARSASYRALLDYRAGDTNAAANGFRRAMELAERCGGADMLMYAAQNLAVVSHQQGDLGRALDAYQRSIRMATAMGETAAEVTARANLAKLYADIGLFERARHAAERAEVDARRAGQVLAGLTALQVRAEVALFLGHRDEALSLARDAASRSAEEKTLRELVEAQLLVADAELALGRAGPPPPSVDEARKLAADLGAHDLHARVATVEARVALESGDADRAIEALEAARVLSGRLGQTWVSAEIERCLAEAHGRKGSTAGAARHAAAAVAHWRKMAASLPPRYIDAFWSHPRHRCEEPTRPGRADPSIGRELALERLLEVNRRLSASLDVAELFGYAIDSALELTGAERGLVLLRPEGDGQPASLEVAAGRNLGGRGDDEPLAYSTNIAERVIETGRPVVSADALRDPRFGALPSVHARGIESVLGVPIRLSERVIGVLYLDHRSRRGLFDSDAVRLLGAFADQVAIALTNARLVRELADRTRELDRERKRIERLAVGQAEQIEELTGRVMEQQRHLEHRHDTAGIVGRSRAMARVFATLDRVIDAPVPILIEGESGTGKEVIAKAIHYGSRRRTRPFVAVNCAAMPESLLEAELFGYRKGAFTGAAADRDGLFVAAKGGTVLLDEVGEMPASMQVKLLRVLQEHRVRPLGATHTVAIEYRLVCATNRRLRDEVATGRFREDLFYRIGVVEITLPPLRDRREDIPELVDRTLSAAVGRGSRIASRVARDAMGALLEYDWPGNVRELENVLTKAALLASGDEIRLEDLDLPSGTRGRGATGREEWRDQESGAMLGMLRSCRWNVTEAARRMGIPRATFYRKMRRYGLRSGG